MKKNTNILKSFVTNQKSHHFNFFGIAYLDSGMVVVLSSPDLLSNINYIFHFSIKKETFLIRIAYLKKGIKIKLKKNLAIQNNYNTFFL